MRVDLSKHRVVVRAMLGLAQGFALYALQRALDEKIWPSTDRFVFTPLVLVVGFVPLIFLFGIGNLRTWTLRIWGASATLLLAGLASHAAARVTSDLTDFESAAVLVAF